MRVTLERRTFLLAAGAVFLAGLAPRARAAAEKGDALFAAAFGRRSGGFGVAVLGEDGAVLHALDLPERGHDVVFDGISRRSVVFARQPGTFAVAFSHEGRRAPQTIASAPGRHFFGHGAFSPDGRLLYATENDFEAARGVIGIYDASAENFPRIGEFASGGIGPHEVLLLPDGRTLAVANGGIETHPDFGRAELNLSTMKPSLSLIDRETGEIGENHALAPDLHQLSIRHMDVDGAGTLWFGCQHRGPLSERPALVGRFRRGEAPELLEMPQAPLLALRNYVGSVAANARAGTIAVSSPQGNAVVVIEAASGKVLNTSALTEVCGLAPDGPGFLATTGMGAVVRPDGAASQAPDCAWDNHILRLS